jgi:arylsulfatase A-like enzyme
MWAGKSSTLPSARREAFGGSVGNRETVAKLRTARGLDLVLAWGTAAAALGLGLGIEEVLSHGYSALGFSRSSYLVLRDSVTDAVVAGVIAASIAVVVLSVVILAWGRLTAGRNREGRGLAAWRFAGGVTAGLVVLAVLSFAPDAPAPRTALAVALVTVVVAATLAAPRLHAGSPGLKATLGALASIALFGPVMILSLGIPDRYYFSLGEVVTRNTAVVAAVVICFLLTRSAWLRSLGAGSPRLSPALTRIVLAAFTLGLPLALWVLTPALARPTLSAANVKNVVLIGIDTLRADRTTLLDPTVEGRSLTPNLRALASRGTVFGSAVSQSSWTLPSFASILTGRYPQQHGAMFLTGTLRESEVTLPEVLREAGYATGAVVSHFYVDERHGFSQGFDRFRTDYDPMVRTLVNSERVTDLGLEFLDRHRDDDFFLFLHYFDPHYEWMNHAGWDFADSYAGWLREDPMDIYNLRAKRHLLETPEVDWLRALYDEEIAYTDAAIGQVLDYLRDHGLLETTAIIVVSDHGEEFLERGWLGHTITLNEEVVAVPLVAVLPGAGGDGTVVESTVETRSLFATVLDYLEIDDTKRPGASLLPLVRGEAAAAGSDVAYASVWLPPDRSDVGKNVVMSSVRSGEWKLIVDHLRGREQLYDLATDPGEAVDLSGERPEKLAELLTLLDDWVAEMREAGVDLPHLEPDDELREKLRSLGYL